MLDEQQLEKAVLLTLIQETQQAKTASAKASALRNLSEAAGKLENDRRAREEAASVRGRLTGETAQDANDYLQSLIRHFEALVNGGYERSQRHSETDERVLESMDALDHPSFATRLFHDLRERTSTSVVDYCIRHYREAGINFLAKALEVYGKAALQAELKNQ